MTEEQFDALVDLMRSIAYEESGRATHQPRAKGGYTYDAARLAFDLPLKEEQP
jgi:hypothetical protein